MFVNNQISDDQLGFFLGSLSDLQTQGLKAISIGTQNEFGKKSCQIVMERLLDKKPPHHLEVFKLSGCKIQSLNSNYILEQLSKTCFLKKLQLSKCKLNEISVDYLCHLVKGHGAPNLIDLDICWNELGPFQIQKFFLALAANRKLQYLNIAWNDIPQVDDFDMRPLCTFVRKNDDLTHLDCSGVFSKEKQIKSLIRAVSKSVSLQVLHLDYTSLV